MPINLLDRNRATALYDLSSWQGQIFRKFEEQMTGGVEPFPCTFGRVGFKKNQLRYLFLDPYEPGELAVNLSCFVKQSKSYGQNTSLVVFTKPGPILSLAEFSEKFWMILWDLSLIDDSPWPDNIPLDIDHHAWEFCFAGEPLFVVCNTPAHVLRRSRYSASLTLTFQPRWVFEKIFITEHSATQACTEVRAGVALYDAIAPSPFLGRYGLPNVREYKQYFLYDDNETEVKCPFTKCGAKSNLAKMADEG